VEKHGAQPETVDEPKAVQKAPAFRQATDSTIVTLDVPPLPYWA
jgi:hypothetical protein